MEREFLNGQNSNRTLIINNIGKTATKTLRKKEAKSKELPRKVILIKKWTKNISASETVTGDW